ncbi:MAG: hypothetical protein E7316_04645 [Clostridiales bacterium]|nr:hypothetical protein [Clostridiales bacterium]
MTDIRLPRLMDRSLRELCRLEPSSLSIEENLTPLSTAVMTLPAAGPQVETGQFVELFTLQGSAGLFRVEQVERNYQTSTRVYLSHSLITLADSLYITPEAEGALSVPQLFRGILSQQKLWQAGRIEVPSGTKVTIEGSGSLLDALSEMMDALPDYRLAFDHTTQPWALHLLALTEACATECRLTRNLRSLTVETDRSELCTQLFLPDIAEPLVADTIDQWGAVSAQLSADADLGEAELRTRGQQYLDKHKNPQVTVSLEALELCGITGAALDSFRLGGMCRVCLPDHPTPLTQRIVTLSWPDVYGTPEAVKVTLANKPQTATTLLSSLVVDTTRIRKRVVEQWDELDTQKSLLIAAQNDITLCAKDMITLRSGVAENTAQITLMDGQITANANAISLKADRIELDGYVTMEAFNSAFARIDNLESGLTTASWLRTSDLTVKDSASINLLNCTTGRFDRLTINGLTLTTRTVTVLTGASFQATGTVAIRDAAGNVTGYAITGGNVNCSTKEITYVAFA